MARRLPQGPFEVPLLAWGDARHAQRAYRRRVLVRAAALVGLGALLALTIQAPPAPRLVWNASSSAPLGLYQVELGGHIRRGDMVVARLPADVRQLAAQRRYLPLGVLLVKQVAAIERAEVCAQGRFILIDRRAVVLRQEIDGWGRGLPRWQGCRRLAHGEVFLLMAGNKSSFDGRYFGVTTGRDIVGKARLVWPK